MPSRLKGLLGPDDIAAVVDATGSLRRHHVRLRAHPARGVGTAADAAGLTPHSEAMATGEVVVWPCSSTSSYICQVSCTCDGRSLGSGPPSRPRRRAAATPGAVGPVQPLGPRRPPPLAPPDRQWRPTPRRRATAPDLVSLGGRARSSGSCRWFAGPDRAAVDWLRFLVASPGRPRGGYWCTG